MTLNDFMNEASYRDYLLIVEEKLSEKIDAELEVNEIVLNLLNEFLEKAEVSLSDLKWLLENHREETAYYIAKKYEMYHEPDGGEEGIINDPLMLNFPIGHLIEYYLILKKPEKLVDYIRSIRIPGAKKYAKEIKKIFDDVQYE
jgi:hypothetical protein